MNEIDEWVGPTRNTLWDVRRAQEKYGLDETPVPQHPSDISPDLLNRIIRSVRSDVTVERVEVVDAKTFGTAVGQVSSANRVALRVEYTRDTKTADALPTDLVLKLGRSDIQLGPLYVNETRFYQRLAPEVNIEIPSCLGAVFNVKTQGFAMLLGDLNAAGAHFCSVMDEASVDHVRKLVELQAKLHARYWESARFNRDLSWLETHVDGILAEFMDYNAAVAGNFGLQHAKFKRELLEQMRMTAEEFISGTKAVQLHQATLPQTLVHGDAHFANTYIHADGRVGLCDWQLAVRGYCLHDVAYTIVTGLSIGQRRKVENDLLIYYIDRLHFYGVKNPPTRDDLWSEYRRAVMWGFWAGWAGTPVTNYGWEINVVTHLRLAAAFQDLETRKAVAELR